MKRATLIIASATAIACVPDLDLRASRVTASRVVAVRAEPAEARPGEQVTWNAVVVTPLNAPAEQQLDWAMCLAPRSPADSITVSGACFQAINPDNPAATVTMLPGFGFSTQGTIPVEVCRKVGPEVPTIDDMGNNQRPPDADITGGYQLPIRMVLSNSAGVDISFDRQRVRCNLASAPSDAARDYENRYKNNVNPEIGSIVFSGNPAPADGSVGFQVPAGSRLPVGITWDPAVRETYILFDPIARQLQDRQENLEIGWYTNGGEFERDRTTPDQGGNSSANELILDPNLTQPITVWIILRDDRGGVGVGTLTITPT